MYLSLPATLSESTRGLQPSVGPVILWRVQLKDSSRVEIRLSGRTATIGLQRAAVRDEHHTASLVAAGTLVRLVRLKRDSVDQGSRQRASPTIVDMMEPVDELA